MTTDTEDVRGGADWELGEAARKLTLALRSSDEAAIAEAMRDHAAAVGSKSTAMIAALFIPLMQSLTEQKKALDTLVDTMQHIAATVKAMAAAQRRTESRIAKLEAHVTEHDARLAHIELLLGARPAERAAEHQTIIDEIRRGYGH